MSIIAIIDSIIRRLIRRKRLADFAHKRGLSFSASKDKKMKERYPFLDEITHWGGYAYNMIYGQYKGHKVLFFDYKRGHISGDKLEERYFSYFIIHLEDSFPEIKIMPKLNIFMPFFFKRLQSKR